MKPDSKVMFEIFREGGPEGPFRVIYYTELNDMERDEEIERAMNGEHVFDGFLPAGHRDAKAQVSRLIEQLNRGASLSTGQIKTQLAGVLV